MPGILLLRSLALLVKRTGLWWLNFPLEVSGPGLAVLMDSIHGMVVDVDPVQTTASEAIFVRVQGLKDLLEVVVPDDECLERFRFFELQITSPVRLCLQKRSWRWSVKFQSPSWRDRTLSCEAKFFCQDTHAVESLFLRGSRKVGVPDIQVTFVTTQSKYSQSAFDVFDPRKKS